MSRVVPEGTFLGRTLKRECVNELVISIVSYAATARIDTHSHETAYACLILAGTYSESFDRRSRVRSPMTLVFHPAGEKHAQRFHGDRVVSFNIEVGRSWVVGHLPVTQLLDRSIECHGDASAAIAMKLWREFSSLAPDPIVMDAQLNELLATFDQARPGDGRRPPPWVSSIREIIDQRFAEPWQLRTLAAEIGIHPVHLAATFRRTTGYSVGEYVRRCRLRYAQARLRDGRATLSSIALDAGFADQSHFARTFRRFVGVTPAAFRRTLSLVQDSTNDVEYSVDVTHAKQRERAVD